jgi:hypothetical protein
VAAWRGIYQVREIPETPSGRSRLVADAGAAHHDRRERRARARHGRWLGGVRAGLAARWGAPAARD